MKGWVYGHHEAEQEEILTQTPAQSKLHATDPAASKARLEVLLLDFCKGTLGNDNFLI